MKKRKIKKEDFISFILALVLLAGGISLGANADKIYYWCADRLGVDVEQDDVDEHENEVGEDNSLTDE